MEDQILDACLVGFFPEMPGRLCQQISGLVISGRFGADFVDKALKLQIAANYPESLDKFRLFLNTVTTLRNGLNSVISGFNHDLLNEFPAQRLIRVQFDTKEAVDWSDFWPACGGKFYGGEMIALKWDRIWWRISAFGLPVAPFQLGSGYDLEDVDRDEAEALGLIKPRERPPTIKIEYSPADLAARIAASLQKHCSS